MSAEVLPSQLGRYRVLRQLGVGGMATVYLAEDPQLRRKVAVKVPHLDRENRAEIVERFMREARLSAQIEHPNLCKVHDLAELHDGTPFIVLRYIEGEPLNLRVGPQRLWDVPRAIRLVQRLAGAMQTLHRNGVIHRDLKPSNVMVQPDGDPVIMDFGLARATGPQSQVLTKPDQTIGTPAYMAPEQVDPQGRQASATTDVYALGVILYELVTGQRPFNGSTGEVYGQILHAAPRAPSSVRPGLPTALDLVCATAMAKDPAARYSSMTAFALELGKAGASSAVVETPNAGIDSTPPESEKISESWPGDKAAGHQTWPKPNAAVAASPTNGRLTLDPIADVELEPAQFRPVSVRVTRDYCDGPIQLSLEGLPAGVRAQPGLVPVGQTQGGLTVTADNDARPASVYARLLALAGEARAETAVRVTVKFPPPPAEILNSLGMRFVLVAPGAFLMGSPENELMRYPDEVQHRVRITRPFYLSVHPVTQGDYETVMSANPSWFSPSGRGSKQLTTRDAHRHPVESVTWDEAVAFCIRLSEYPEEKALDREYRLPTEAEWEFACRGGTSVVESAAFCLERPVFQLSARQANCDGRFPYGGERVAAFLQRTSAVGAYRPNPLGVMDMHGNVWEWCLDWYGSYDVAGKVQRDPTGPATGTERVVRGGSWFTQAHECRAANRHRLMPHRRCGDVGFRILLPVPGLSS